MPPLAQARRAACTWLSRGVAHIRLAACAHSAPLASPVLSLLGPATCGPPNHAACAPSAAMHCSPNICVYAYVVVGVGWAASLIIILSQVGHWCFVPVRRGGEERRRGGGEVMGGRTGPPPCSPSYLKWVDDRACAKGQVIGSTNEGGVPCNHCFVLRCSRQSGRRHLQHRPCQQAASQLQAPQLIQ